MASKYTVKKKGNRFTVTGPRGVWKTTYASEAKARKGITQARKHWASMGKPKKKKKSSSKSSKSSSKSKKSSKKKSTKKKVKHVVKKRSWIGYARLGVYLLAAGGTAIRTVAQDGFTAKAAENIALRYTARDASGHLSMKSARDTYAPLALVAIVDTAASKLGVYKRMGSL